MYFMEAESVPAVKFNPCRSASTCRWHRSRRVRAFPSYFREVGHEPGETGQRFQCFPGLIALREPVLDRRFSVVPKRGIPEIMHQSRGRRDDLNPLCLFAGQAARRDQLLGNS